MKIYGVAILAACYLLGKLMGSLLGEWMGINGNIGGVGFAMALLLFVNSYIYQKQPLSQKTSEGILFWSALYIPIVVAMSATQNVKAALSGGWVAILVGVLCTLTCFLLVPLLSKIGRTETPK